VPSHRLDVTCRQCLEVGTAPFVASCAGREMVSGDVFFNAITVDPDFDYLIIDSAIFPDDIERRIGQIVTGYLMPFFGDERRTAFEEPIRAALRPLFYTE